MCCGKIPQQMSKYSIGIIYSRITERVTVTVIVRVTVRSTASRGRLR